MTTIRYAAFLLAAITLWALYLLPPDPTNTNPAAFWLVGFFALCFGVVCWTCRERRTTHD